MSESYWPAVNFTDPNFNGYGVRRVCQIKMKKIRAYLKALAVCGTLQKQVSNNINSKQTIFAVWLLRLVNHCAQSLPFVRVLTNIVHQLSDPNAPRAAKVLWRFLLLICGERFGVCNAQAEVIENPNKTRQFTKIWMGS